MGFAYYIRGRVGQPRDMHTPTFKCLLFRDWLAASQLRFLALRDVGGVKESIDMMNSR